MNSNLLLQVEKKLAKLCSELLKVNVSDLDVDTDLIEYGVDSIQMMRLLNLLETEFEQSIPPTAIAEQRTIRHLADFLIRKGIASAGVDHSGSKEQTIAKTQLINTKVNRFSVDQLPHIIKRHRRNRFRVSTQQINNTRKIAIIAAACRLPQSSSLESFWEHLKASDDLIVASNGGRWDEQAYFNPDKTQVDSTYTTHGGYLQDVAGFDAAYFGIKDEEAISMDPQHRIILELTQELFDRAGYTGDELSGSRTGVYLGAKENNYGRNGDGYIPDSALQHTLVNTIGNMISARVSDTYNLTGPAKTIDTACSSSLVAVHDACQAIMTDEATLAVAGGIHILIDPFGHISLSRAQVLSPDGKSYVFDERAQGFVLSEGAGLVLLKDYDQAIQDGDQILGVILGSAVNNDGKTMGLTVPSQQGQKDVIQTALTRSQVDPVSITYLEAHGTGTLLGDPIEIKAATEVYRGYTDKVGYCAVGSVKSNLGHTMLAAGITSLIKVILALQHRRIPATLHCEKPHPRFGFDHSPFYPITKLKDWQPEEGIRRAAISSFGFGGTNCHMIVEEAPEDYQPKRKSLPLTVFHHQHYWLGEEMVELESLSSVNETIELESKKEESLMSDGISAIFNYNEPYLADHLVQQRQIILGVTYASLALSHSGISGIKNLLFIEPVALDENNHSITFSLYSNQQGKFQVFSHSNKPIAEGIYLYGSNQPLPSYDLQKLQQDILRTVEGQSLYQLEREVIHGPSLQTLMKVYVHTDYCLAELMLTEAMKQDSRSYPIVHPALLDGALVAGMTSELGFALSDNNIFLPFMIKEIQIYQPVPSVCYSFSKRIKQNVEMIEIDFSLLDVNGQVCLTVTGFVCKRLRQEKIVSVQERDHVESVAYSNEEIIANIEQDIEKRIKSLLLDPHSLSLEKNFMDLGVESIQLIKLSKELETDLRIELYPTLFFEYPHIRALAQYFSAEHSTAWQAYFEKHHNISTVQANKKAKAVKITTNIHAHDISVSEQPSVFHHRSTSRRAIASNVSQGTQFSKEPIAIIGMSGVFAQSPDLNTFWQHLYNKTDLIQEIPLDHFDYKPWFSEESQADKLYCKWGSFIHDVDKFDASYFSISPREAELMDPQLRYLLQTMVHTAEDAGLGSRIRGTHTGVYVGVCFHDYMEEMSRSGKLVDPYEGTGNAATMLANRPSFYFNFTGPSLAVDTACSSSLVALHLACKALQQGECEMAFVAGVNLLLSSWHYRYFCSIGALSKSGRCHTFDARADGYVPGDAIAAVLLKPLSKAVADGDHIYGIIKGSAVTHGGYTPSITAPSVDGEAKVLLEAWQDAGIDPWTISYIEAHGTGTKLGDPVEISALKKAWDYFSRANKNVTRSILSSTLPCGLGSAKAHIGHTEGAAGIAGIIKVLLSMHYRTLPAMPKFEQINPYISLEGTPFYINTQPQSWETSRDDKGREIPRRAGVNSFGFGGAYAHVVLEEYIEPAHSETKLEGSALIVLSAKNVACLAAYAQQLLKFIEDCPNTNLADLAYTLQIGREAMDERLGIMATSIEVLENKLKKYLEGKQDIKQLYQGQVKHNKESLIVFATDEDMVRTIEAWVEKRKYPKLLELWTKGFNVGWEMLYKDLSQEQKPRRISAPTYPFAKERYWVETAVSDRGLWVESGKAQVLHAMIDSNESTFSEQLFKKTLSSDEFYLRDHLVNGHMWFPGTGYLEMARAAGELAANQAVTRILDVVWLRPISLEKHSSQTIYIGLIPDEEESAHFKIFSDSQSGKHIFCEGKLNYASVKCELLPLDLSAIRKRCTKFTNHESIYSRFTQYGLDYRESFQTSICFYSNEIEILQEIDLPTAYQKTGVQFGLHPCLIDAALRTVLWQQLVEGSVMPPLSVPFTLDELIIYKPIQRKCYAYSQINPVPLNNMIQSENIIICDGEGNILGTIKGFRARAVKAAFSESKDTLSCYEV
ncbi:MAG: polyketide synthase dehydratase domain-containing protein, partial [Gammaproteobacteria bacterium]|nr:polyketide synthase dehydratase domain-containing protein [Gammaproteobacteria bacterium]